MPSIKNLKKNIDNQIFEIISDCFLFSGLHPEKKPDDVNSIVEDAVALRNDLIARINNRGSVTDNKDLKKHLQAVTADLDKGVIDFCSRLSAISKKKK